MRPIEELIDTKESGWDLVQEWMSEATNELQVLAATLTKRRTALYQTQITTKSPMGAIVYHTGGILVDQGWVRILGAGSVQLSRSLPDWNLGKAFNETGDPVPFLLVADDAIGGFFALNNGGLGDDLGMIYYFSPDTLDWEPLEVTFSTFIYWILTGDLADFYQGLRWNNWYDDVKKMGPDRIMSFYPFLWMAAENLEDRKRSDIPVEEAWNLQMDVRGQLSRTKGD